MLSGLFRKRKNKASASIAKERLQIIVAHERKQFGNTSEPDFLQAMQRDILQVVGKYMKIDNEQIKIAMDKEDGCDVLELNIVLLDKDEIEK